jgi:TrmH family RNA methyltransferase
VTFWKDNIFFILVEPQQPGNIGAAARALQNMGFRNLELVNPIYFLTKEARRMAYQAYNLLKQAPVYAEFDDAIHDKHLIVGTTRRLGTRMGLIVSLKDSVRRIITTAKRNKVAIVFGRERNGLTNQEVTQCGFLVTIPSEPETPSLNLAQSVLLVAYELSQKAYKTASPELVKHENVIALYEKIASTLKLLAYIPRGDRDLEKQIIRNMKHLIGRAGLTEWELNMLYGICSQVEKKLKESVSLGSKNLETGECK